MHILSSVYPPHQGYSGYVTHIFIVNRRSRYGTTTLVDLRLPLESVFRTQDDMLAIWVGMHSSSTSIPVMLIPVLEIL